MLELNRRFAASAAAVLLGGVVAGCIGRSQTPQCPTDGSGGPGAAPDSATLAKACPNGVRPAVDGLIDDMEDGNSQLALLAGRDGYWWSAHDDKGSTIEPAEFTPLEAGPGGNGLAVMYHGLTSSGTGAWGTNFGATFLSGGAYDASKYVGISFSAKVGKDSTKKIRFKVGDINTHKDGGLCKDCWNHFGKDLTLSTEWQDYQVLFSELKQADGWGDPRPPSVSVSQLWNIDFSIGPGMRYEVWVDDVQFLECK